MYSPHSGKATIFSFGFVTAFTRFVISPFFAATMMHRPGPGQKEPLSSRNKYILIELLVMAGSLAPKRKLFSKLIGSIWATTPTTTYNSSFTKFALLIDENDLQLSRNNYFTMSPRAPFVMESRAVVVVALILELETRWNGEIPLRRPASSRSICSNPVEIDLLLLLLLLGALKPAEWCW